MKIFKKFYSALTLAFLTLALPALTKAETKTNAATEVLKGLNTSAGQAGLKTTDLPTIIGSIISYFLGFLGVIFVVLMIYGGYMWMTSYGEQEKIKKAKALITDAIIGLVIILAAYAVTTFVIKAITGTALS